MENNNDTSDNSDDEQFQSSDDGSIILGRPCLILVVDTMSRMIVGCHLSIKMPPKIDGSSKNGRSED